MKCRDRISARNNPRIGAARLLLVRLALLVGLTLVLASEARVAGPKRTEVKAKNLPVTITAVNLGEGVATCKDTAGSVFQFPAKPATLKGLKVGQQVDTKFIREAVSLSGGKLPHCPCGKRDDGKCWCSKCVGDPCFKIGCPYGDCRSGPKQTPIEVEGRGPRPY